MPGIKELPLHIRKREFSFQQHCHVLREWLGKRQLFTGDGMGKRKLMGMKSGTGNEGVVLGAVQKITRERMT